MTRKEAQRVIARRMDGNDVAPELISQACRIYRMRPATLEKCRKAADSVTVRAPLLLELAETEIEALSLHGLDSNVEYDDP